MANNRKILGTFSLVMIGISAIFALRNLPIVAVYGLSSVIFYFIAALVFFLPSAWVCAQLVKHLPKAGGLYTWVKEALGNDFGFIAIWLEWVNTVVSFPMMIGFILFTIIYEFDPTLAKSRLFEFAFFQVVFWGLTIVNLLGLKTSSRFSSIGVLAGALFPAALIIILGIIWLLTGRYSHISFSFSHLIPTFHWGTLTFLIAVTNSLSGIQIIAFHVRETNNPARMFPKVCFYIVSIVLLLAILGALSIAVVTPAHSSNLIGGIIESLTTFFSSFGLAWIIPVVGGLIALGVLSEVNTWMLGPSKGMLAAAENGDLPKIFSKKNRVGSPVSILISQGVTGSLLASVYLLMPSVNSAYWLLSDLTAELTLLMWVLVFVSGFVISIQKQKEATSSIKKTLFRVATITGALTCGGIALIGFIPPTKIIAHNVITEYETFLLGGVILFLVIPVAIRFFNTLHKKRRLYGNLT